MKPTYVYVFGSDDCPRIKIGISDDPTRREIELINGCGFENARILWKSSPLSKKEALYHEATLHERFKKNRTSGEWFYSDKVTVADVKQYFAEHQIKPTIKFRGRRIKFKHLGEIVYGGYSQHNDGTTLIWHDGGAGAIVDPKSVSQFVGFDADGREVYEGDTLVDKNGHEYTAQLVCNVLNNEGFLLNIPLEKLKLTEDT